MLFRKQIRYDFLILFYLFNRSRIQNVECSLGILGGLWRDLACAFAQGLRSLAIVFLHGYRYPEHERLAKVIAQAIGFEQISVSHEVSPVIKVVSWGDATVMDAYLSPILRRYVDSIADQLPGVEFLFIVNLARNPVLEGGEG